MRFSVLVMLHGAIELWPVAPNMMLQLLLMMMMMTMMIY